MVRDGGRGACALPDGEASGLSFSRRVTTLHLPRRLLCHNPCAAIEQEGLADEHMSTGHAVVAILYSVKQTLALKALEHLTPANAIVAFLCPF